ncbi:MAG: hypothetical protein AAFU41_16970 [Pseudomonadota bacterium]
MTRIFLILAALVAIGGGAFWFLNRPAELTLRAELTAGGVDVTDQITWSVLEVLAQNSGGGVSMSDVVRVEPTAGTSNVFAVNGGQLHAVTAQLAGLNSFEMEITPPAGGSVTETMVLDAGLIDVNVLADGNPDLRFFVGYDTGGFGGGISAGELQLVAVPDGSYVVGVTDEVTEVSTSIDVTAGEVYEVTLDIRQGDLILTLPNWDASLPTGFAVLSPVDGTDVNEAAFNAEGEATFSGLTYGDYSISLNLTGVQETPAPTVVIVESASTTSPIDWDVIRVNVDISAVDTIEGRFPLVQVVEIGDRGIPYTATDVTDATSYALPFAPIEGDPDDLEFGVLVRASGKVFALQSIGRPAPGETINVTLEPNTGGELCDWLFGSGGCAMEAN